MPTVKVRNLFNEEVGDLELPDAVFGAELKRRNGSRPKVKSVGSCNLG